MVITVALTGILAALWWFADGTARTYAGWGAILLGIWSVVSVAAFATSFFEAKKTADYVMSRLSAGE